MTLTAGLCAPLTAFADNGDAPIGRLFTDPVERTRMDRYRSGEKPRETVEKPSVSSVRVDGVMMRSDGENVIWLNGKDTLDSDRINGIRVEPDAVDGDRLEVPVRVDGQRVRIKPGQRWTQGTGKVADDY